MLREQGSLDPVDIYRDKTGDWLADGFHRLEAYMKEGKTEIPARIHKGGRREAIKYGFGCNDVEKRSSDDKRHSIRMAFADPEWSTWSDRGIAQLCRVSWHTVADVRTELAMESGGQTPTSRRGLDGKNYPGSNSVAAIMKSLPPALQKKYTEALERGETLPPEAPKGLGTGVKKRLKLDFCIGGCGRHGTCDRGGCDKLLPLEKALPAFLARYFELGRDVGMVPYDRKDIIRIVSEMK